MKIALLNKPTSAIEACELTYLDRAPIQLDAALGQHAAYAAALGNLGVRVEALNINKTSPDAVFVEDVAIILDEVAVIASMGSPARRAEVAAMVPIIAGYRSEVRRVSPPATIDGGDVLKVGKRLFVGNTSRTNPAGIQALAEITRPFGYTVAPVDVWGCLHLKTGITALSDETFIVNPLWIDISPFRKTNLIPVPEEESWGANALRVEDRLILNAAFPRTADKIEWLGFEAERVDISEFGKAEAGLTCMSLIFNEKEASS